MKSLTRDDLEWSVGNKSWATQPHNESTLNEAFKVALQCRFWTDLVDVRKRLPYF